MGIREEQPEPTAEIGEPQQPTSGKRRRKYSLDDLLAQVTESNLHGELDSGPSVGEELW